VLRERSSILD